MDVRIAFDYTRQDAVELKYAHEIYNDASKSVVMFRNGKVQVGAEGIPLARSGDIRLLLGNTAQEAWLNWSKSDVLIIVRTYVYDIIDKGSDVRGYYRCADTIFTFDELFTCAKNQKYISKPISSASDMLYEGKKVYRSHGMVKLMFHASLTKSPPPAMINTTSLAGRVFDCIIQPEMKAMEEYRENHVSEYAAQCANPRQCYHPPYFTIPGLLATRYRLSAQSFFYHSGPAATEAWFAARVQEVLAYRGISNFNALVDSAIEGGNHDAHHECLHVANEVLRMHTCSRPYVPDHDWSEIGRGANRQMYGVDQETCGLSCQGDCEDSTSAVYALSMTLLFPSTPYRNADVINLRKCAAMLGVPVGVSGTFVDPDCPTPVDPTEAGHFYSAAIPFLTFAAAISGSYEDVGNTREVFRDLFGFDCPEWHIQPAITEGVYRTTMFYSDHWHVNAKKKQNMERVKEYINKEGKYNACDRAWAWDKVSYVVPLDVRWHRSHGRAFRCFTDVLHHIPQWNLQPEYVVGGAAAAAGGASPLSFLMLSNIPSEMSASDVLSTISPDHRRAAPNDPMVEHLLQIIDQIKGIDKWGISVDFISASKDMLADKPVFRLKCLIPLTQECVDADRTLRLAYDRPILPLVAYPPDYFKADDSVQNPISSWRRPVGGGGGGGVPFDTNRRVTVFAYGMSHQEIERMADDLKRKVGGTQYWLLPCAFATAVVIEVK
jgi:hypothetical protein